jgi:hypothetical protein
MQVSRDGGGGSRTITQKSWLGKYERSPSSRARYFIEHRGKPFHIHFHLNNATSLTRGASCPTRDDSEELRAELLRLLDKQFETLELSTCVTLTHEEQREYEVRKQRIHELFKQLGTLWPLRKFESLNSLDANFHYGSYTRGSSRMASGQTGNPEQSNNGVREPRAGQPFAIGDSRY